MDKITLKQQFDKILNANHKLAVENEELQARIDKAIEYIQKENTDISMIDKMNILDILRGEDNESN